MTLHFIYDDNRTGPAVCGSYDLVLALLDPRDGAEQGRFARDYYRDRKRLSGWTATDLHANAVCAREGRNR